MREHRPVLIHVGYPKCASSLIQEHAARMTDRLDFLSKRTTPEFFNEFMVSEFDFDPDATRSLIPQSDKPVLISYEGFLANPMFTMPGPGVFARRLRAVFPEANIVIVVRNQVDMVESFLIEWVSGGGSGRLGVKDFFHLVSLHHFFRFDLSYFQFSRAVRFYEGLFGRDRVHVMLFEEIITDIHGLFARFGTLLNTDLDSADYSGKRVRSRISWLLYLYLRVTNPWRRGLFNPAGGPFGAQIPRLTRLESVIDRIGRMLPKLRPFNEAHRRQVSAACALDNQALGDLIGRDLSEFGYPL